MRSAEPVVGMGATILHWTDREAATVVEVGPGWVVVRIDIATRIDNNGMSDAQRYSYTADPEGGSYLFKRAKDGTWRAARRSDAGRIVFLEPKGGGNRLMIGVRDHYHDFSF